MNLDVESKLVDFMTDTASALGRIEQSEEEASQDRAELHKEIEIIRENCSKCMAKLPGIEVGLTNHLRTHDKILTYIIYPVAVSVIIAALGVLFKVVLHVF